MTEPVTNLHEHLTDWRRQHHMTLQDLSAATGTPISTLNRWENGNRRVTLDGLSLLAEAYGVKPWELLQPPPDTLVPPMLPPPGGRGRSVFPTQSSPVVVNSVRLERMERAVKAMFRERKRTRRLLREIMASRLAEEALDSSWLREPEVEIEGEQVAA